jgi:hypothetical protein
MVALTIAALLFGILWVVVNVRITSAPASEDAASVNSSSASTPLELQAPRDDDARVPPKLTKASSPKDERNAATKPPTLPAAIRGRVVDAETDAPIDAFEVVNVIAGAEQTLVDTMLGQESSIESASTPYSGSGGRFEIAVPDAEERSVCAFAPGYGRSEPVTARPGDELEIRLDRAGTVRGRVVDPSTGNPVEGALVGWIDRQGKARNGPRDRFIRTDGFGRFEIECIPFSARAVVAGREDLGEGTSERLDLAPDTSEREVVIELRRSGG